MTRPESIPLFSGRPGSLRFIFLAEIACCVVPAMALVWLGSPALGARWLFAMLGLALGWHVITRNPAAYLTVFAGCIPAAMMLRGYFYFSSIMVFLMGGFLLWFAVSPDGFRKLWRNRVFTGFFIAAMLYWWLSFLATGTYSTNLRILELALSAAAVFLLGGYRSYLATALVGLGLTTVAVSIGVSPYGDRLGMAEIGEASLGNPIALGLPSGLVLLLAIAHDGDWLLARGRPMRRMLLLGGAGACLLLSTSRGSWLVATVGLLVILTLTRRRRAAILLWLAPLVVAGGLVLASGRGEVVTRYFNRAVSSDRTLAQRTTGRFNQWAAMPHIFSLSPVWGYGPGSGLETNIRFTGSHKAWHSLYLQICVELGGVGLLLLALLFGSLVARGMRHRRVTGDVIPVMGTVCFMTIAVSVSGMDAISGVFLGLGFLAQDYTGTYALRELVVPEVPDGRPARATAA